MSRQEDFNLEHFLRTIEELDGATVEGLGKVTMPSGSFETLFKGAKHLVDENRALKDANTSISNIENQKDEWQEFGETAYEAASDLYFDRDSELEKARETIAKIHTMTEDDSEPGKIE